MSGKKLVDGKVTDGEVLVVDYPGARNWVVYCLLISAGAFAIYFIGIIKCYY